MKRTRSITAYGFRNITKPKKGEKCCEKEMHIKTSYFNGEDSSMTVCFECGAYCIRAIIRGDEK
tara:strand:- start:385 stop:576 length:192 start_codon:yes stop_codon:yes gene_type:complete